MNEMTVVPQAEEFAPEEEMLLSVLSATEEEDLVKKLKEQYDTSMADVANFHKDIEGWHKLYAVYKEKSVKKFPWKGASNYRIPLILSVIDSYHARLVKAVFEVDPLWMTRARTPEGEQAAFKAQWYLDYWADQADVPLELDENMLNMLIEGSSIIKIDWVRQAQDIPQLEAAEGAPAEIEQFLNGPSSFISYDGPKITNVSLTDFVMIPADSPSIEEAVYVGHKVWRTQQQLIATERAGYYYNTDKLFEKSRGDNKINKQSTARVVSNNAEGKYPETNQYEIIELYGPYEWEEGNPTPTVFTFSAQHEVLLRIEPYQYQVGRPPYLDFKVFFEPGSFYGRSLAALLESAQAELTGIHNLRMDAISRTVAPPILKKFGTPWNEDKDPLIPNSIIAVNDATDVQELILRDIPNGMFSHEQDLMSFVERSTGMSDTSMGRMNNQYASATAVNRVTSEGLARVDVSVSRYQYGMKRLGWFLWWLLYQYRPFLDYFFAESQQMSIQKIEMRPGQNGMMPFEIIPQGMLSDVSKEALRQQKLMMFQITSGVLGQHYPDGLQKLLDELLKAHDIQDRSGILGPAWSVIQQQLQQAFQQGMQEGAKGAAQAAS